jgi:cytoskeletal protein CcmA (bactofilin family)
MPSKNNKKPSKSLTRKPVGKRSHSASKPDSQATAKISGAFEGSISAQCDLNIVEGARCRATIRAKRVDVHGEFEGNVAAVDGLWVGNKGRCKGSLNTPSLLVDGFVEGEAVVHDRMDLSPSAAMKGHIVASRLVVADGASFDGRCTIGKFATEQAKKNAA